MGRRVKVLEPIEYRGKHLAAGRWIRCTLEEEKNICRKYEEKVVIIDHVTGQILGRPVEISEERYAELREKKNTVKKLATAARKKKISKTTKTDK